jgi:hypothetical protein
MSSSLYVYSTLLLIRSLVTQEYQAASAVSSDYDDLLDLFERLGNFLKRLDIYINIPPTETMTNIIVKIMVELLSVLVLAKKKIKRGRFCTYTIKYPSRWLNVGQ